MRTLAIAVILGLCWSSRAAEATPLADEDLTGEWDGGGDDWAVVKIKTTQDGHIGTYSSTFNSELGNFRLEKTGDGNFKGEWWENNLMRHGSFELTLSKDGKSLSVRWKATDGDDSKPKDGKSVWTRKN